MPSTRRQTLGLLWTLLLAGCGGGGGSAGPGTVSGTAIAAPYTAVDSDLNAPDTPTVANDSPATAQVVVAPVTIGGYVNVSGTGPAGSSRDSGDPLDVFRAELTAGTQITLHTAGGDPAADLDLYLLPADNAGEQLDGSLNAAPLEIIDVPHDGSYYVMVQAVTGAANYILSIGTARAASGGEQLRLADRFVAGDAVVRFKDTAGQRGLARSEPGRQAGGDGRPMLLTVADRRAAIAGADAAEYGPGGLPLSAQQQHRLTTLLAIKALQRRPDIEYAEPNYIRRSLATPNDNEYQRQWHYPLINLPLAWDYRSRERAAEPIVAVIDSGVLSDHRDLQGVLVDGYDFIRDPARALDGDGIDANPDDPGDQAKDSTFHGTHVAGTVGARTDNGLGVAGVSWGARIMPLRVLGKGGATSYDVQQAARYAARLPNDSGRLPARQADIVNLSLGGSSWSRAEQELVLRARARGVLVIAAAGNESSSAPFYPAAYDGVVAVGAVDRYGSRAPYSNYGRYIDVAAPGGDLSADRDGDGERDGIRSTAGWIADGRIWTGYRSYQGTSMAAPHVAGVAALMKAIAPALTPADFDALLAAGDITEDIGRPGRDDIYGHGLIDAYRAVLAAHALAGNSLPPAARDPLDVWPTALLLDAQTAAAVLSVDAPSADAEPAVAAVRGSERWLSIAPTTVDNAGRGHYTVAVDRADLVPGGHAATIDILSSAGTMRLPVAMQVEASAAPGDAGPHYALLLDADSGATVAQQRVAAADGRYPFRFEDVPPGSYHVVVGADADNDGYICGPGEACSASATGPRPVAVSAGGRTTVADLITRFDPTMPRQTPTQGFRRLR